jgi:hypothetical protein
MTPIEFGEQNAIFAKDQPPYQPLPAHVGGGIVTSCWKLEPVEIELLQSTGVIWLQAFTFGRAPQPILPSVFPPNLRRDA